MWTLSKKQNVNVVTIGIAWRLTRKVWKVGRVNKKRRHRPRLKGGRCLNEKRQSMVRKDNKY